MDEKTTQADLTGTLIRDTGGFTLRTEDGLQIRLSLHRVPVDHVEKRVRVVGIWIDELTIEVDGVAPI